MAERVKMNHPRMDGVAQPLKDEVPKWEAAGWRVKDEPQKKRAKDQAEPLVSPVEGADSAKTTANGKGK